MITFLRHEYLKSKLVHVNDDLRFEKEAIRVNENRVNEAKIEIAKKYEELRDEAKNEYERKLSELNRAEAQDRLERIVLVEHANEVRRQKVFDLQQEILDIKEELKQ